MHHVEVNDFAEQADKFDRVLEALTTKLCHTCTKHSTLSTVLEYFNIKTIIMSDAFF